MSAKLSLIKNPACGRERPDWMDRFTPKKAEQVRAFHRSLPEYGETPLRFLPALAERLGVSAIAIKDESARFGLGAFKGLGGSYCVSRYQAGHPGEGPVTFVTATDGNHGRGIAWAAQRMGCRAVVYMPAGSAEERLENIRALGAEASRTSLNYDDTVRYASSQAAQNGWVLVQDTSWPGYEEIPALIMQGYLTMADEAADQLEGRVPTHIFLQAGVGAMAGALTAYFCSRYGFGPRIVIVEPDKADCGYRTALANDGRLHRVEGALDTIMAGLACGEPCTIGWELLHYGADAFLSMEDAVAATGMRVLGAPLAGDPRIISGESGAAGFGALYEILAHRPGLREALGLDGRSTVLCFSTEGATDRENYRRIVWNGSYPTAEETE